MHAHLLSYICKLQLCPSLAKSVIEGFCFKFCLALFSDVSEFLPVLSHSCEKRNLPL